MTAAIERELQQLLDLAGGKREPRLGCSTISHDRFGFCAGCHHPFEDGTRGSGLELNAWRLLAMRSASDLVPGLKAARTVVEHQTDLTELVHFERPSDFRKGVLTCLVALDNAITEASDG